MVTRMIAVIIPFQVRMWVCVFLVGVLGSPYQGGLVAFRGRKSSAKSEVLLSSRNAGSQELQLCCNESDLICRVVQTALCGIC